METLYAIYNLGYFTKRGFLYGPICPIYGFGALLLILFFAKYRKHNLKLFIYSAIVFSAFEYVVSYCLDALFSRISIFYSFAWGIIAIIFINHVYPFFKKKINVILSKIPYNFQAAILYLLCSVWALDTVFSFIRYL